MVMMDCSFALHNRKKKEVGENKEAEKKEYSFYKMAIISWLWITKN